METLNIQRKVSSALELRLYSHLPTHTHTSNLTTIAFRRNIIQYVRWQCATTPRCLCVHSLSSVRILTKPHITGGTCCADFGWFCFLSRRVSRSFVPKLKWERMRASLYYYWCFLFLGTWWQKKKHWAEVGRRILQAKWKCSKMNKKESYSQTHFNGTWVGCGIGAFRSPVRRISPGKMEQEQYTPALPLHCRHHTHTHTQRAT